MGRRKKSDEHYVDNAKFTEEVSKYADATRAAIADGVEPEDLPRMNDYIGSCVLKIATRLSTSPNFVNYSYREEMISDGIENVFLYLKNFDASKAIEKKKKPNAFAYVTQIIYFAFLRRIEKEKKQQFIKQKSIENIGMYTQYSTIDAHDTGSYQNQFIDMIQNNLEFTYVPKTAAEKKKEREEKKNDKTVRRPKSRGRKPKPKGNKLVD